MSLNADQRRANLKLALILATIAVVLGVGFVVKIALFNGGH